MTLNPVPSSCDEAMMRFILSAFARQDLTVRELGENANKSKIKQILHYHFNIHRRPVLYIHCVGSSK
jgi:hypothetical protein